MFSYWTEQMAKIQAFKAFKGMAEISGKLMSPLGFTLTQEGVELHVLEAASMSHGPVFMDFDKPQTHRMQMTLMMERKEDTPQWVRKVIFGNCEVLVKGSQSNILDATQIKSAWLLGEAFRQGWRCAAFEKAYYPSYYITSMKLDLQWHELESLMDVATVRFERDHFFDTVLLEKAFDLPLQEVFSEPVTVVLNEICPEKTYVLNIQGITLRDVWEDFENIYEHHRLSGAISEADLKHFKEENNKLFQQTCPRGMRFAVVTYEADPEISIECYASEYLEAPVVVHPMGGASAMGFMISSTEGVGSRGLPLKACVIQQPLHPETQRLSFEIFKVSRRVAQADLIFK